MNIVVSSWGNDHSQFQGCAWYSSICKILMVQLPTMVPPVLTNNNKTCVDDSGVVLNSKLLPQTKKMSHQCKKCNAPVFHTIEKLKNHSRMHSTQCTLKFPVGDLGEPLERSILWDPITQHFFCTRCLSYKTSSAARLQQHCKTCKGED